MMHRIVSVILVEDTLGVGVALGFNCAVVTWMTVGDGGGYLRNGANARSDAPYVVRIG
jgi:hypothetical protein